MADIDGETMGSVSYVDVVLDQCEICRASEKASRVPIAGTTTASAFDEKLHVDLLSLDDAIASRAKNDPRARPNL